MNIEAETKKEALEFVSEKAEELKLTDNKEGLLCAFINREEEFSTGLQGGFAIPHAKSEYAKKAAVLYVRLKKPLLDWETMDDQPVTELFALIVPEANAGNDHLMMISKLATSLLEDDFKDTLKSLTQKTTLKNYIIKILEEEA